MALYREPTERGFSIGAFRAVRNQQGILRQHDFHIEIPWPDGLPRDETLLGVHRSIELACDSINFPLTALQTYGVQRYGYGTMETKPILPQFGQLQTTFLTDQYSNLWRFFHDWMRIAVNYDFSPNQTATGQAEIFEISYTREYTVDMFLYIYNPIGDLVRKVGFRQAYPIAVMDVPLSWALGNQAIRVPVAFAFFDWNEELVQHAHVAQPQRPPPIK